MKLRIKQMYRDWEKEEIMHVQNTRENQSGRFKERRQNKESGKL